MRDERSEFIVSRKPNKYLEQGATHCGVFIIKAILSAYNRDSHEDPRDYHISWFGRLTGGVFPRGFVKILARHGVGAEVGKVPRWFSNEEKVDFIKELLEEDKPLTLLTGYGYLRGGGYSRLKAKLVGHWITLWGYDEGRKVLYVYDPAVSREYRDNVPIGNKARTYEEILRDWEGPWLPYPVRNLYIRLC